MQEDIWKIAGTLLLATLMGLASGFVLLSLLIFCFGIIVWQMLRLKKLYKWVSNPSIQSVPDADGQIYLILRKLAKRDQKAKKRQRQLTGYLTQVRKAIGALPDAIILIDEMGKIEWANNNALNLMGIRWPADNGLRLADLVRDGEIDSLLKQSPLDAQGVEISSAIKRDTVLNVKCLAYTEELRMVIARDVTRLVRTNRMQRDFVANVSHELKTPLTVLKGYIEILLDHEAKPEGFAKPLDQMNVQSQRMELIVSDLLYLAKLESSEQADADEVVDMDSVIRSIIESVQPLIDEKQHHIKIDTDPGIKLLGVVSELSSAVSNLITNAIHYTPANGQVKVSWKRTPLGATFTVEDNGDGIEEQHIERLTQRFYRVDTNRSRDGGGTGLGLAIVKHVLQRHSSELEISSIVGEGSQFVCHFPESQLMLPSSTGSSSGTQTGSELEQNKVTRIY